MRTPIIMRYLDKTVLLLLETIAVAMIKDLSINIGGWYVAVDCEEEGLFVPCVDGSPSDSLCEWYMSGPIVAAGLQSAPPAFLSAKEAGKCINKLWAQPPFEYHNIQQGGAVVRECCFSFIPCYDKATEKHWTLVRHKFRMRGKGSYCWAVLEGEINSEKEVLDQIELPTHANTSNVRELPDEILRAIYDDIIRDCDLKSQNFDELYDLHFAHTLWDTADRIKESVSQDVWTDGNPHAVGVTYARISLGPSTPSPIPTKSGTCTKLPPCPMSMSRVSCSSK